MAIVDDNSWHVDVCQKVSKLCSKEDMFVQHLALRRVERGTRTRVFNAHIPTSSGTAPRKKAIIAKMCAIATGGGSSGVEGRAMTDAWIIGGDLNLDVATMGQQCNDYVEAHVPCVSLSGWPCDKDAQKADFALSQGIDITQVRSWIGFHSKPCASDIHDAVVVMGCVKSATRSTASTHPPLLDQCAPPMYSPALLEPNLFAHDLAHLIASSGPG